MKSSPTVDELSEFVDKVFDMDFDTYIKYIESIGEGEMNVEYMGALLRIGSLDGEYFDSWKEFLEEAKRQCVLQGYEVNDVLYGFKI